MTGPAPDGTGDRAGQPGGPADGDAERLAAWAAAPPIVVTERIERKDIVRFAIATGATDPVHLDVAAARRRGYDDLVAPPLYYIALRTSLFNAVPITELSGEGTPLQDAPPIAFSQAMAGETEAELIRPFVAGRLVTCSRRVRSTDRKRGRSGMLTFICWEYRYADAEAGPCVVERFTRIFR